jgi:hypothetical protein
MKTAIVGLVCLLVLVVVSLAAWRFLVLPRTQVSQGPPATVLSGIYLSTDQQDPPRPAAMMVWERSTGDGLAVGVCLPDGTSWSWEIKPDVYLVGGKWRAALIIIPGNDDGGNKPVVPVRPERNKR